jgi:hypothetical protein
VGGTLNPQRLGGLAIEQFAPRASCESSARSRGSSLPALEMHWTRKMSKNFGMLCTTETKIQEKGQERTLSRWCFRLSRLYLLRTSGLEQSRATPRIS